MINPDSKGIGALIGSRAVSERHYRDPITV